MEDEANARLIAAASELYEALKLAVEGLEIARGNFSAYEIADDFRDAAMQARAALAKVEGR